MYGQVHLKKEKKTHLKKDRKRSLETQSIKDATEFLLFKKKAQNVY